MIPKTSHLKTLLMMVLVAGIATAGFARAENKLPEIMVGQTTLTANGQIVYGGMVGNEVILNYDPNLLSTGNLLGFNTGPLIACNTSMSATCYALDPTTSSMKLMTSRTNVNGSDVLEISTLLYPNISIVGDIYGVDNSNFALYGRNLKKNSEHATGETWNAGNSYAMNTQAQASYSTDQAQYYNNHVAALRGEATTIAAADLTNNTTWNLQNDAIGGGATSESSKYPEGKVWHVKPENCELTGNLTLNQNTTYTYNGNGTLIIDCNLVVRAGTKIIKNPSTAEDSPSPSLGIIVGSPSSPKETILFGNNRIEAAVFASGNMRIGNNVEAVGSFTASNFYKISNDADILDSSNYGIRFIYDYKLENNWPPGFRYFNMPSSTNAAP